MEPKEVVDHLRETFDANTTRSVNWRLNQLKALKKFLLENEAELCEATKKDLHKSEFETKITELAPIFEEINMLSKNLKKWAKGTSVERPAPKIIWAMDSLEVYPQPYGVVLIIAPWNYPIQLALVPVAGAIAAGNTVLLKPSEISNHVEHIFKHTLTKYLNETAFRVITGGSEVTSEILKLQFDYIFFTGSTNVGKIVYKAAAEHLTPVTLELGGKSPVIITRNCPEMDLVAKRIIWGKFMNCGQTCIAPDYILMVKGNEKEFIDAFKTHVTEMYGENAKESECYGRIINQSHFERLSGYLKSGTIAYGGETDEEQRYIQPTLLINPPLDSDVMQTEIFGPILPLITVDTVEDAIKFINKRPKPLALYLFATEGYIVEKVKRETSSGAFVTNDVVIHFTCNTLPFGGVGESGIGSYHGIHSFHTFSHLKPVLQKTTFLESANTVRYPPFTDNKLAAVQFALRYPKY